MKSAAPAVLDYYTPRQTGPHRGGIAILAALCLFGARIGWDHVQKPAAPVAVAAVPASLTFVVTPGVDMQTGNSLNHNSEGANVLYADGHIMPTTMPYGGENRGQNGNAWLDNIYKVQSSNLASNGGVVSGVPYDDRDAIMLPTSN